jgi:REP element-mobilizing transposase RayT
MDADKFKGRYRIATTRLQSWDYAADAYYFVTICTQGRWHFFGDVVNDAMQLSAIGEVAHQFWADIPRHFAHVALDEYVVMPNHVHGIVIIQREHLPNVETRHGASLPPASPIPPSEAANEFGPLKPGSLQSVVNQYKGSVTRWCRKNHHTAFAWQSGYYDHIIRSEESLRRIRDYVVNNPLKWALDKENQPALWM